MREPDTANATISRKALKKLLTMLKTFNLAVVVQLLSNNALVLVKFEIFPDNMSNRRT